MVVVVEVTYAIGAYECASGAVYSFNYLLFQGSTLLILLAESCRKNNESASTLLRCQCPDYSRAVAGSNGNHCQVGTGKLRNVGISCQPLNNRRFRVNNINFTTKITVEQIL